MKLDSFPDPHATLPCIQQHRTSLVTDKRIWATINSCHGARGTLQTTVNILLQKLYEQLKRNNLDTFSPVAYEHAVLGCRIILGELPRSTEHDNAEETPDRDDGRGTSGVVLVPPHDGD